MHSSCCLLLNELQQDVVGAQALLHLLTPLLKTRWDHHRWGTELVGWRGSRLAASTATSISWDGLTLDPRPFARFDEHNTLTCGKKPVQYAKKKECCVALFRVVFRLLNTSV